MSTEFVIYGAGSTGRDVLQVLEASGQRVLGFLDRARNEEIGNLPCVHPESEEAARWRESGAGVVVALWNPGVPIDEVESQLLAQQWASVENFLSFRARHSQALGQRFWLGEAGHEGIGAARSLWADSKSRHLFELRLRAQHDNDVAGLNRAWREEEGAQYFPSDVEGWPRTPLSFVDCGAYDGDTLREVKQKIRSEGLDYYGFEPDGRNFGSLSLAARELCDSSSDWTAALWPCGVWSESSRLNFDSRGLGSSALSEGGADIVPVVALDDVLQNVPVQILKMDIEGAEPEALRGAKKLIMAQKPALAVCVYHAPEHLWQIPAMLDSWNLGYRFFLRAHAANGFDWVLYAVSV